jgi:hypothetical protein
LLDTMPLSSLLRADSDMVALCVSERKRYMRWFCKIWVV